MKRLKKLAVVILAVVVLSQLPFAYRRYRFEQLHNAIQELNTRRRVYEPAGEYREYKGVIHVHTALGGHSTGKLSDVVQAARENHLDFVVMTEHPSKYVDTGEMTLSGLHGEVLFINGNEISTSDGDRFLVMPGHGFAAMQQGSASELIAHKATAGNLAFVAYPQDFHSWQVKDFDGIEVYNLYTNARQTPRFVTFFDALWSLRAHPELLFTDFFHRPDDNLHRWDEALKSQSRKIVAIAGNDAHANIGFGLTDSSGNRFVYLQVDPYARSFALVRNHVMVELEKPFDSDAVLSALRSGHSYISFDVLGDATGFAFEADNGVTRKVMGDEIGIERGVHLRVSTPIKASVHLFKDGNMIAGQANTQEAEFEIHDAGVYRVEAYLNQLPLNNSLWIISNPIYVK